MKEYSEYNSSPADMFVLEGGHKYDRWIIGEGANSRTEYIVHLSVPRFIAKITDDQGDEPDSDFTISIHGTVFFDVLWIDSPVTGDQDLLALFTQAEKALFRDALKADPEDDE